MDCTHTIKIIDKCIIYDRIFFILLVIQENHWDTHLYCKLKIMIPFLPLVASITMEIRVYLFFSHSWYSGFLNCMVLVSMIAFYSCFVVTMLLYTCTFFYRICLSVYLSIYLSTKICLLFLFSIPCVYTFIFLSISHFVLLSFCLSVRPSVFLCNSLKT